MTMDILIIDSDSSTIQLFESLIVHRALSFQQEKTGAGGLKAAESKQPSLIILSVELDDMNGFMVCKKLRESKKLKRIPIIIVSTELGEKSFKQHKKLKTRADVYLNKPFVPSEILDIISKLLAINLDVDAASPEEELDLDHLLDDIDLMDIDLDTAEDEGPETLDHFSIIQELKAQNEAHEHQLEYYKKELDASKLFFSQMQGQQSGDSVELKNKEQECERLAYELEELKTKREEAQETILELTRKSKKAAENLKDSLETINGLTLQVEEERHTSSQFERKIKKLTENLMSQDETRLGKKEEEKEIIKRSQNLEADLYKTQEILDEMNIKIDEKEMVSKTRDLAIQDEIKELETALENARNTNQQLEEILMDRETDIQELEESFQSCEKQKGEDDVQKNEIEQENQRIKREHSEIIASMNEEFLELITTTRDEAEKEMRAQLDEIQEGAEKRIEELNQQLTEVDQENEELKNRIESVLNEKKEKEENWQLEIHNLEDRHRSEMSQSDEEIQTIESEISELKLKLRNLDLMTDEQALELKTLNDDKIHLLDELKEAAEKEAILIRGQDEEMRSLGESHSRLQEENDVKLKQAYTLQEELCEQRDLLKNELEEKNQVLALSHDKAQETQQKLHEEMEQIEKRNAKIVSDQERQIEELRGELTSTTRELETKSAAINSLEKRVDQLNLGHKTLKDRLSFAQQILETGLNNLKGESETLDFEE